MKDNKDIACYFITKHSWKGKYKRIFSVGTLGITTYNPQMEITNQWLYNEVVGVAASSKGQLNNEFAIIVRKGKKQDTMKFSSDHRPDIITEALRFRSKFADPPMQYASYNACKHHWSENKLPVVLEVGPGSLEQKDPKTNKVLTSYDYKDVETLVLLSDYPGGFAVVYGGFGRMHLFAVDKRDELLKKICEQAWLTVGVSVRVSRDTISFDRFCNNRFGKFSSDEYITCITEFPVHKVTQRHNSPVKRLLGLAECCLVERDTGTYSITSLKPLSEVCALIRSVENPQMFCIEYVKGQIRTYTSTERDALLASLLDGVRASGNRDIHVKMVFTDRGKRLGPATVPVDEEVETCHLKFLQFLPAGWDFVEAVTRFNCNIPYNGLLHSVTQDGLFAENKEKLIQAALVALLDKEGDQGSISNEALEAQFQCLRRLVASKIGFSSFLQLPKFRERLGMKVVKALKRNDDDVTHAAVDMICALMQPMHDDYDLRQEQMNKSSLLSSKTFLTNLLDMFVQHVTKGTGALVVAAMLDFLTFALCVPYSETTDGEHFDTLLGMVAEHGRYLFRLFQHPSLAIVKGAGLVMKAVIEEGSSEVAAKMQELALAEGALPRHLHMAMFLQSNDSRRMATQQLSRQLVALWVTEHPTAMALLRRTVPSGLLTYLESSDPVPQQNRDLINTRDNLKIVQDHSQRNLRKGTPSLLVIEKHLEVFLQHWRARIGLHKKDDKMQQRPVVLRKRRERIKSECNWPMFYYQFNQDHTCPDLIWNYKTREELRDALENEMRQFNVDRDLCQTVIIAWNHMEFEVAYPSLSQEIKIGEYYLRLLLEEDENDSAENSYIKRSYEFFNDLYHRFLLTSQIDMRSMCLQVMAIVYGRHHEDIGPFNDTRYIVGMLERCIDRLERDRLVIFISKLILNRRNVKELIDSNGLKTLIELLTLAHMHINRATVPMQTNVIEASPDTAYDTEQEWYFGNAEKERRGPHSFSEMKQLCVEGVLNRKTRCWAQGMDGWRPLNNVPQLKWCLMATGSALMNESDLASLVLSMLIRICEYFPSRDSDGAIVRPLPKAKRLLSDPSCLPHIVQLLLTFDPILVEKVAILLSHVVQDNPNMPRLYLTGFFYFILMYTGSNVLPIGQLLQSTHSFQAFRSEETSNIMSRSILGQLLPEAMVCYLENHGAKKFAEIFLGEFDTPEAIWNNEMRRMMIEKIAAHISEFTPRLKSNTRALYQYCPIPILQYPQLENELFCSTYYLRHLCDTQRFPDWPIRDPIQLLRDVLDAWKQEVEKKPPPLSIEDAYEVLGLRREDSFDEAVVRKAYFKLAQKYHPDKNPDGRELFEKVNKAYEFICSKSSKYCNGPDPQNITLILRTQSILFSRYRTELHPYKYAGYPMLIKTIQMETRDDQLFSKPIPLLPAATETAFHTVNCSALNAEELRREGGLQLLQEAFSRCVGVLSYSSKPVDVPVQVSKHIAQCFTVAAQFSACRVRLTEMPSVIGDLARILYYKHLTKLCLIAVECVSSLCVDEILQNQLFEAGCLFHLLIYLFNYDYTLEEGGVERSEESNQQEIANQLAKLSVKACISLGGYQREECCTPPNRTIQHALSAMLTPYLARQLAKLPRHEVLKILNSNTENPYLIWNNATRAELTEYLKAQQKEKIRSGECDPSYGADFLFSAHSDELIIGEIFVRVYNEQPTFALENARGFTLDLLAYLSNQAQYLYSLMALKDSGVKVQKDANRLGKIEMSLEALHNVIHNNPGVEIQCIGQFKLLFSLLRLDGCAKVQALAIDVISGVTGNQECVNDIAASEVLVYSLIVLKSLSLSKNQITVLETLLPLMSNSKLVKEAMAKGAAIYLLDLFCNSPNPRVRELTAELFAKMTTDKLIGPKLRITLIAFLPQLFLDAMKDSPQAAVHLFEGTQENPELIWNDEARERLCTSVESLADEHYKVQKDNPVVTWKMPEELRVGLPNLQGETVIAGVYLRIFIQNPAWVLRRPREFLIELLDKAHELISKPNRDEELLETVTTALVCLFQAQPSLLERVPTLGHIPRLVQVLATPVGSTVCKSWIQILHQLANNEACVKSLCRTECINSLMKAMQTNSGTMDVACETLNRIFQHGFDDLIQQALDYKLVELLLEMLGGRLDNVQNIAASKAQLVQALKAMSESSFLGEKVNAILDVCPVWAEYKDQKHDLFITPTPTAGYLTGTANVAGYLTQGSSKYMPSSPPPMEEV